MTRTAWFNCFAGTAGDMTLAALVDAGADAAQVAAAVASLDVDGYALTFEHTQRCGIRATLAVVALDGHDDHPHRPYKELRQLLEQADLAPRVRERAQRVFAALASVEAEMHQMAIDDVELHEVGSVDAIVDIVGACAALESLGIDHIVCSPIALGHGTAGMAHGTYPNPAPATVALLARSGATARGIDATLETATPTGVALMTALSDRFGPMPAMTVASVGYGAGSADVPGRANVVQVVVGESNDTLVPSPGQEARIFEANVDDVSGEVVAHAIASLLAAGAQDAWATPIVMKKGRPAYTVTALCDPARADAVARVLVEETGTLGLRGTAVQRWPQARTDEVIEVDGRPIRVKLAGGRVKPENDDAVAAAHALGRPLRSVLEAVQRQRPLDG